MIYYILYYALVWYGCGLGGPSEKSDTLQFLQMPVMYPNRQIVSSQFGQLLDRYFYCSLFR